MSIVTLGYVVAGLALVGILAFALWPKIGPWFRDSETLFFGRLQIAVGTVLSALAMTDFGPVLSAFGQQKWVPVAVIVTGVLTEVLRRARDPDLK